MNQRFDLIVIGDSAQGNSTIKNTAGVKKAIKTAFISKTFKSKTTHDFLNVEYVQGEVVLIDYNRGLFGCYLDNGDIAYGTHIVVATGLNYSPLILNNKTVPCVFNTTDEISKTAKLQQAIVLGKNDTDVSFAIKVAKKYKHVYFCMETLTAAISEAGLRKLESLDNLVILPNASLARFSVTDNKLSSVELTNYATLTCAAIFVKTESTPATAFIPNNLIVKDQDGYLLTSTSQESTLVPKLFAIGNCSKNNSKKANFALCEAILADF